MYYVWYKKIQFYRASCCQLSYRAQHKLYELARKREVEQASCGVQKIVSMRELKKNVTSLGRANPPCPCVVSSTYRCFCPNVNAHISGFLDIQINRNWQISTFTIWNGVHHIKSCLFLVLFEMLLLSGKRSKVLNKIWSNLSSHAARIYWTSCPVISIFG